MRVFNFRERFIQVRRALDDFSFPLAHKSLLFQHNIPYLRIVFCYGSPDINVVRNIITVMIHNKDKHLAWISGILFQRVKQAQYADNGPVH